MRVDGAIRKHGVRMRFSPGLHMVPHAAMRIPEAVPIYPAAVKKPAVANVLHGTDMIPHGNVGVLFVLHDSLGTPPQCQHILISKTGVPLMASRSSTYTVVPSTRTSRTS